MVRKQQIDPSDLRRAQAMADYGFPEELNALVKKIKRQQITPEERKEQKKILAAARHDKQMRRAQMIEKRYLIENMKKVPKNERITNEVMHKYANKITKAHGNDVFDLKVKMKGRDRGQPYKGRKHIVIAKEVKSLSQKVLRHNGYRKGLIKFQNGKLDTVIALNKTIKGKHNEQIGHKRPMPPGLRRYWEQKHGIVQHQ